MSPSDSIQQVVAQARRRAALLAALRTELREKSWPLTQRQCEIYEFIRHSILVNHHTPSLREICAAFGFRSKNAANDHIAALAELGMLLRAGGLYLTHGRFSLPSAGAIQ